MNQKAALIRADQWRKTVYECINRDPKLSKRQWCQENGVKFRSLMYWQHKFQMEAIQLMESLEVSLPIKEEASNIPAFADMTPQLEALRTEQEPVPQDPESPALTPELMIQAGSYRVYVNGSVREATLETVMRVLNHA